MIGFNTQVGGGIYCLQLETDNQEVYQTVQSVIRAFMDREHKNQVVVSKIATTTQREAEESSVGVSGGEEFACLT